MADGDSRAAEIARLRRRADRERTARLAAEAEAERGLRELYDARREADLLRSIATAANEAGAIGPTLRRCLRLIAEYSRAAVGHAWMCADSGDFLFATGIWYGDNDGAFEVLQAATDAQIFHVGEGLPGRVVATGEPVWMEDVHTDTTFLRNKTGARFDVGAAFGLPVRIGPRVCAVLELFFRDAAPPDRRILSVSADIGAQIGRVIERARSSLALTRARDELERRMRESAANLERMNEELRREIADRDAADTANRAKSEFLANMSHEIRTPMSAVLGYADLLMDVALTPQERHEYVRTIRRNGEHLLTVLNDILDFSKMEAGKLSVEKTPCDIARAVADVTSLMRVRALEKNLALSVEFASPIPRSFPCDATRLRQILLNLAGNAIKFTERGAVRIVVRCEGIESSDPKLLISVVDDGVGMSKEQIAGLFRPFVQADSSTTRKFGGSGLGLAISKRLAEMLGGTLTVESEVGRGSTFTLALATGSLESAPMVAGLHEVSAHRPSIVLHPETTCTARVLLAEDGRDNQRVICAFLEKAGASVKVAENGRLAVNEALAALAAGTPYDVVLMDMQMPELDGYGAATELRMAGYRHPIIALTAHAMATDRDQCLRAGCDDYLSKPVDRAGLVAMVQRWSRSAPLRTTLQDDDDMRPLVAAFTSEAPLRAERIRDASQRLDVATLRVMAHHLRGSAATFGFAPVGDAGARLEDAIAASASNDVVTSRVNDLLELLDRVR